MTCHLSLGLIQKKMMIKDADKTAWVKAMDYLARRDHSEKELIEKLSKRYTQEEIEEVLTEMKDRGWLAPPEELAAKATLQMHKKNKGYLYIQHFLRKKGLPQTPRDSEIEYEKALSVIQAKSKDPKDLKRLASLLKNRGFDTETISRVINEVRRNTPSIY